MKQGNLGMRLVLRCMLPLAVPPVCACFGMDVLQHLSDDVEMTGAASVSAGLLDV
jgi:hypothetical protein